MDDLISIVIPIYNVEKYLKQCIKTVISQTYTNIEIILVDDGSTDGSLEICYEFKEKDNRIKVIHKKNGGLSDARNVGIEKAKGKFICFIDSDDYINKEYIKKLYNSIKNNNSEIAICNFQQVDEGGIPISSNDIISGNFPNIEGLEKFNDRKFYPASVVAWNKLYDINLFEDVRYPIGKLHEDEYTTYKLFYKANRITVTNEILYYYRKVQTSITNKKFNKKRLDIIAGLEEKMQFFKNKNEQKLYNLTLIEYAFVLMEYYKNIKLYLENSKDIQIEILSKYRNNFKELIKAKECSTINKIKFSIIYISPMLYHKIKKIIK